MIFSFTSDSFKSLRFVLCCCCFFLIWLSGRDFPFLIMWDWTPLYFSHILYSHHFTRSWTALSINSQYAVLLVGFSGVTEQILATRIPSFTIVGQRVSCRWGIGFYPPPPNSILMLPLWAALHLLSMIFFFCLSLCSFEYSFFISL